MFTAHDCEILDTDIREVSAEERLPEPFADAQEHRLCAARLSVRVNQLNAVLRENGIPIPPWLGAKVDEQGAVFVNGK